jgi:hypothetical protein
LEISVGNVTATVCWELKGVLLVVFEESESNQTYLFLCNTDTMAYSYSAKYTQIFLLGREAKNPAHSVTSISVFNRIVCESKNDILHIEKVQ